MIKRFCDICGLEMKERDQYSVVRKLNVRVVDEINSLIYSVTVDSTFSMTQDGEVISIDLCLSCKRFIIFSLDPFDDSRTTVYYREAKN